MLSLSDQWQSPLWPSHSQILCHSWFMWLARRMKDIKAIQMFKYVYLRNVRFTRDYQEQTSIAIVHASYRRDSMAFQDIMTPFDLEYSFGNDSGRESILIASIKVTFEPLLLTKRVQWRQPSSFRRWILPWLGLASIGVDTPTGKTLSSWRSSKSSPFCMLRLSRCSTGRLMVKIPQVPLRRRLFTRQFGLF